MKKFWSVSGAVLLISGLLIYFFTRFYQFAGLFLCALGALCLLFRLALHFKSKVFLRILTICTLLGLVLMTATGIWIGTCMGGAEDPEADYVVVLGAGVNGTVPSISLEERLKTVYSYLEEYPESIAILSGCQGSGEDISEAQCMYNWLTERGVADSRLWIDEKATTTRGNITCPLELIEEKTGSRPEVLALVSSEYHLCRAELIGRQEGIIPLGVPAGTRNIFYLSNMLVREIFGVWATFLGY